MPAERPDDEEIISAAALGEPLEGVEWGPKMAGLPNDRWRAFVLALYQVPLGRGSQVAAAKRAGFGKPDSKAETWAAIGYRLAHDERVLDAIHEEDQKRIRSSAPRALRALSNLIEDPGHRDHGRAIGMVMDRIHPVATTHTVKVEHEPSKQMGDLTERLLSIALTFGLDAQKVLATPQRALAPPATIDGECSEVKEGTPS